MKYTIEETITWSKEGEPAPSVLAWNGSEKCSTCSKPYNKFEISICSNSFHCCRDCKWSMGRVIEVCSECKEIFGEKMKIICETCQEQNVKSTVEEGMTSVTAMYCAPFFDEEGNRHVHDTNVQRTSFTCSNGHSFTKQNKNSCWCGWEQ